ncbi:ABC transporter ATP-binding protein [Tropicibacter sp. S64]|uniref:ABC transporter ATP-binding protein n=1 Tax=Tropicibacter sp. S64 TaxID=3415122 RepID=UPI003C7E5294
MTPDLACLDLTRRFGDHTAVDAVNFTVPPGTFFSILGPSGCGKTTIMRMIAGFLEPTSGDIRIKGKSVLDVPPNKRPVNMVFQHLALFPMMTIAENIGYGLRRRGMAKAEISTKVGEALERIGLPGIGHRKVTELSGGQKQRVAIARCMVLEPDVLLLDEPLGALDLKLREHMKVELKALQAAFDTTFVYITHDQSEALVMSDQIAVMNNGRFEQVGTGQDLYYRPETPFVAGFIGEANKWQGVVERVEGDRLSLRTDSGLTMTGAARGLTPGDRAQVFVRPESIRIAGDASQLSAFDNLLEGAVSEILFNGAASRVQVTDDAGEVIEVTLPQSGEYATLKRGDRVHVGWSGAQGNAFAVAP